MAHKDYYQFHKDSYTSDNNPSYRVHTVQTWPSSKTEHSLCIDMITMAASGSIAGCVPTTIIGHLSLSGYSPPYTRTYDATTRTYGVKFGSPETIIGTITVRPLVDGELHNCQLDLSKIEIKSLTRLASSILAGDDKRVLEISVEVLIGG